MVTSSVPTAPGLEALRRSYSTALGMPVDFFIARDFAMLIDAQATSRVEYAVYSATAYATAVELCQCVEPIAAPTDVDGARGIRSILLARKGKMASVSDLPKIKTVAPPSDDISGSVAPFALLSREGVLRDEAPFITVAPSAIEAENIFVKGEADALLGWERISASGVAVLQGGTVDRLRRAGVDVGALDRIWASPVMPYGPHVVVKSLNAEAKTLLSEFLIGLHAADPQAYDLLSGGHSGGFVAVDDSAYAPVHNIVRTMMLPDP